jgi:hypothetical protein
MSAGGYLDACGFLPVNGGTSNFVVSTAITGYQTPATALAVSGTVYSYRAESADKTQWEGGYGTLTNVSGTWTLARSTVTENSSGSGTLQGGAGTAINFAAAPYIWIVALAADLQNASLLTGGTLPDARLNNVITAGGPTGSATAIPVITYDAHGRLTAVSTATPTLNGLVSEVTYSSTQTINIPAGATRARVWLWGGSGGNNGSGAGALKKYLTGLTPGNTLALTIGAAGASSGTGTGGNSTLASGTQSISTLTANGGVGGTSPSGGTASGGDTNAPGQKALTDTLASCLGTVQMAGMTGLGFSVGGAYSAVGTIGGCFIEWYN